MGLDSARKILSSLSSSWMSGSVNLPRCSSLWMGVFGTTVRVRAERNSGSIAVASLAEAWACSSERFVPPAPSRKMTLVFILANLAFLAASM